MILLRMCLRAKKVLFACSCAFLGLIFLSASNLEYNINVINGKGKGSMIGDFRHLSKPLHKLGMFDYFLDALTGDLLQFNYRSKDWLP